MIIPHPCDFSPKIFYNNNDIIVIDNFYQAYEAEKCISEINTLPFSSYYNKKHRGIGNFKEFSKVVFSSINQPEIYDWQIKSINPEWRYLKGEEGYHMTSHFDESKIISINEKSFYTILLYLNDDDGGDLVFNNLNLTLKPKAGRLIIFNQNLLHHSLPSTNEKYFLHSEIIYERKNKINSENDCNAFTIYNNAQTLPQKERDEQIEKAFKMSNELEKMVFDL